MIGLVVSAKSLIIVLHGELSGGIVLVESLGSFRISHFRFSDSSLSAEHNS